MPATYYELLGIPRHSDVATIEAAYRRLALIWHPDKNPVQHRQETEERFKLIVAAHECLSDTNSRRQYDAAMEDEASMREEQQERTQQQQDRQQQKERSERRTRYNDFCSWFEMQADTWPDRAPHHPWTRALQSPFIRLRSNPQWIGCITGAQGGQDIRNCPARMRLFFVEWHWAGQESKRGEMPMSGQYWMNLFEFEGWEEV